MNDYDMIVFDENGKIISKIGDLSVFSEQIKLNVGQSASFRIGASARAFLSMATDFDTGDSGISGNISLNGDTLTYTATTPIIIFKGIF